MTMSVNVKYFCHVIIHLVIIAAGISAGYADEFSFDVENPKEEVYSPTKIFWNDGTLQIYDGSAEPIHVFNASQSPVIVELKNGHYTFKRWIGSNNEVFNVNILEPVNENGSQFDENSWVTVPGDACKPEILNLTELYDKYGKYVINDNLTNPLQTVLVADGQSHMADNIGTMPSPYIMHNITYLRKMITCTLEGLHSASYSFKIPDLTTGITVEGGLFVWSHINQKNYGTAFQLIVDEAHSNFGKIYYYGGAEGWIDSDRKLNLAADKFYEITFILDVKNRLGEIVLTANDTAVELDNVFSEAEKNGWSTVSTLAHFQAECISKDGVKHSVILKDYSWCYDIDMDNNRADICDDNCPVDPNKTKPGKCGCGRYEPDFYADGTIDLKDAIIALKILTGENDPNLNVGLADTIGLEEVLYTLRCIGGLL